jgi:hypothetical protein
MAQIAGEAFDDLADAKLDKLRSEADRTFVRPASGAFDGRGNAIRSVYADWIERTPNRKAKLEALYAILDDLRKAK